eukprot:353380-Chlamydomonas_euryale.AAC.3
MLSVADTLRFSGRRPNGCRSAALRPSQARHRARPFPPPPLPLPPPLQPPPPIHWLADGEHALPRTPLRKNKLGRDAERCMLVKRSLKAEPTRRPDVASCAEKKRSGVETARLLQVYGCRKRTGVESAEVLNVCGC